MTSTRGGALRERQGGAPNTPKNGRGSKGKASSSEETEKQWLARRLESTKRATAREQISIFKKPVTTVWLFAGVTYDGACSALKWVMKHRAVTLLPVTLILAVYLAVSNVDGPHEEIIAEIEINVAFVVWWVGLGVLSSIGLGTGLHSGMLFLFPHILKTVLFAEVCGHLNFDSRINMWQKALANSAEFICETETGDPVSWLNLFAKLVPTGFLWGLGTALGEIPPYFVSYCAAKLGNQSNEELDELNVGHDMMTKMKRSMISILKRFGFWGVFILSAWPNAAFDLCGMCCGHFLMPFWTFFGGTMAGKACTKAPLQVLVWVGVFCSATRKLLLDFVGQFLQPSQLAWVQAKMEAGIKKFQHVNDKGVDGVETPESGFGAAQIWNLCVFALVGYFALSCIHQFAKFRQQELDEAMLDKQFPLTAKNDKKSKQRARV
mmetsp:Transcript_10875/g.20446  ORF Transcript_10875/g.20446 Transcript_10875/m.20446 type:complete len:436 (-) Transcript_10875:731-2038(-)|eukprot:CAMPEP_0114238032 /NCGR_PEP_ID=MMETSP0058-20121206/7710_1 /TAXON_ID=36894 /ORGANISM="Pyramimonas parkeae, CCMP726" /LENGTH=435 /DNA_ID=CAMNT_0001350119 /DNA_START=155 /DNA_END=1462 /DNA_ORIENTATION=-